MAEGGEGGEGGEAGESGNHVDRKCLVRSDVMKVAKRVLWTLAINILLVNLITGVALAAETPIGGGDNDDARAIAAAETAVRHDKQILDNLPPGSRDAEIAAAKLAKAYEVLGIAYLDAGRNDDAATTLTSAVVLSRDVLRKDPTADALYARSVAYNRIGHAEDAISDLESLLRISDEPGYREELAIAYAKLGKRQAAIEQYKKLLATRPDDAWFNLQIGYLFIQNHDYDLAAQAYEKAAVGRKQLTEALLADVYDNLGIAYFHLCRREESIAAFKQATELNPAYGAGLAAAYHLRCQRQQ
jgi:tetratricopeptide (TPR) repeat protein